MNHIREHRSLLADAEKRLLIFIARRLPRWINSDHLTLIGLLSMPLAGIAFARIPDAPWSAGLFVVALAANWFGDSLDGTLARVRDQQRPRFGYYVDHVIDLAGTAALFAGIGASGSSSVDRDRPVGLLSRGRRKFSHARSRRLPVSFAASDRQNCASFWPSEHSLRSTGRGWTLQVSTRGCGCRRRDRSERLVGAFVLSAIRNTKALYMPSRCRARRRSNTKDTKGHKGKNLS